MANWFKRLFSCHQWERVQRMAAEGELITVMRRSGVVVGTRANEGWAVLEKCALCNVERAYFEEVSGERTEISVHFFTEKHATQ